MNKNRSNITSKRIKELRLDNDYTMEELAELVGVSKSTIAKWENGYVENMRQERIKKLAEIFDVAPSYIMGYGDSQTLYEIHLVDNQEYTPQEKQIIATYRRLDAYRKALADGMMQALADKEETSPGSQESKA